MDSLTAYLERSRKSPGGSGAEEDFQKFDARDHAFDSAVVPSTTKLLENTTTAAASPAAPTAEAAAEVAAASPEESVASIRSVTAIIIASPEIPRRGIGAWLRHVAKRRRRTTALESIREAISS